VPIGGIDLAADYLDDIGNTTYFSLIYFKEGYCTISLGYMRGVSRMINTVETITMLARFIFSFWLLFLFFPSLVIRFRKEDSGILDKLFIRFVHSTLFFIIAVHILVGIRLLETFSLLAIAILGMVAVVFFRKNLSQKKSQFINLLTGFFDLADDRERRNEVIKKGFLALKTTLKSTIQLIKQTVKRHPILLAAYLIVFALAMTDRFRYSFTHLAFASSDSYVHLGWSKYLANMKIYMDGVYPYGFESIIASLYRVVQLDMYIVIRFMGAFTALLMVLSLIYALRKIAQLDYPTILLTVFLLFYSVDMMIGNEVILWRQLSALSMEYAAVFLFPGITFFYLFLKTDQRIYLLLAAECYCISALTHPFVTVTMTFAFLAAGLAFSHTLLKNKRVIRIVIYMGAAGLLGILPPIIGLLAGKPFHGSSINYARGEMTSSEPSTPFLEALINFLMKQPFILILYSFSALYLLGWCIYRWRCRDGERTIQIPSPLLMAVSFHILMVLSFLTPQIGLPTLVPVDRQPVFLSMANALLFGICVGYLMERFKQKKLRYRLQFIGYSAIMLCVWLVPSQKLEFPLGDFHQYDEAMRGYLDIKKNYPFKNWVIISPVDELGVTYGYGYHYELWEFVRDLEDPNVPELTFTTPYVFLYVEKVPIDIMTNDFRPITRADAEKPFPVATSGALTEFYYGANIQNRRILQAKAYYWAEEYLKNHQDMKVFMDTPNMKIYEIYQDDIEVILKKTR
jgi:hypothetical protein